MNHRVESGNTVDFMLRAACLKDGFEKGPPFVALD